MDWVDDTDSRVEVLHTALTDLRGMWRLLGPAARRRAVLRPARPTRTSTGGPTGGTPDRRPVAPGDRCGDRVTALVPGDAVGPAGDRGSPRRPRQGGLRRRAAPVRRGGRGEHRGLRGAVRRSRAGPGQLPGQRGGHRPVQSGQHRRPPGHGRHGPPWARPPAIGWSPRRPWWG